jgi:iron(III) transport system permease protein
MSIADITLVSAARAAVIAILAVAAAVPCARWLRGRTGSRFAWYMIIAFLMPPMIAGYHFATTRALAQGWVSECLYSVLVFFRFAPLAVLLAWLRELDTGRESVYVFDTMARPTRNGLLRWWSFGLWHRFRLPLGVVFLAAFQEFDIAACMNARSWTIAIFDAQSGGLGLSDSLRLLLWPLVVQSIVLGGVMVGAKSGAMRQSRDFHRGESRAAMALFVTIGGMPLLAPIAAFWAGLGGLQNLSLAALFGEVGNSLSLALVATIAAWLLAGWALGGRLRIVLLVVPGLFGMLVLSLGVLSLFQSSWLVPLRGSPLPLLLALSLGLMPFAVLLRYVLSRGTDAESLHVATISGNASAVWMFVKRPALWAAALLFLQAYGDFTANSLLAPPALSSAFSRIFNLMHYGRTSVLSAMLLVSILLLALALFVASWTMRAFFTRRRG